MHSLSCAPVRRIGLAWLVFIFVWLTTQGCIGLRVYAPVPAPYADARTAGSIVVNTDYSKEDQPRQEFFAYQFGSWRGTGVRNRGGTIEQIIARGLARDPARFVPVGETLTVTVRKFSLFSRESLFDSKAYVLLKADIKRGTGTATEFVFAHEIESVVSDSTAMVMTLTLVGWLWYGPYLGFRGTLEDQLNYLGRLAVAALIRRLELRPGGET